MDTHSVTALCSACRVPLVPVTDHDPKDWFACPRCGIGDTRENVLREVGEHSKEVAARYMQDAARETARKSKFIQFKGDPIPKGVYRFIGDLKL